MLGFHLHPTTVAAGMDVYDMFVARRIELADLFLLFIRHTEIVGMVGAYFANNRILGRFH